MVTRPILFATVLPQPNQGGRMAQDEFRSGMESAIREVISNVGSDDGHETALADAYRTVRQ